MAQERTLGANCQLQIFGSTGAQAGPIAVAKVENFSYKKKDKLLEHHPIGQVEPDIQLAYGGYELSFEVGKVSAVLEQVIAGNDAALLAGLAAPRYRLVDRTINYDNTAEEWVYPDCILHDFDITKAMADEVVKQKVTATCTRRFSQFGAAATTSAPQVFGAPAV